MPGQLDLVDGRVGGAGDRHLGWLAGELNGSPGLTNIVPGDTLVDPQVRGFDIVDHEGVVGGV